MRVGPAAMANFSVSATDSEADPVAYVDWQIEDDVVATSYTLAHRYQSAPHW